jgi:hypothetical protein
MAKVITFVYLTIQQSITTVEASMRDVMRHGNKSKFLWGFKLEAYEWLQANKQAVYDNAMNLRNGFADPEVSALETLQYFASLPGLGLVKGGFANQLIFGETGCIDTHNLALFEVNPNRFRASAYKNVSARLQAVKARDYADFCNDVGGPEFLWDNWCRFVSERNNGSWSAHEISAMHVTAILKAA